MVSFGGAGNARSAKKDNVKSQKVRHPLRGEIYLANFDPTIGSEIRKTRPALVIQNNISNEYSPVTIVAAITSEFDLRTEVVVNPAETGLTQTSVVLLNQIRSVDRRRLNQRIGNAGPETMPKINQAIQISLGIVAV